MTALWNCDDFCRLKVALDIPADLEDNEDMIIKMEGDEEDP